MFTGLIETMATVASVKTSTSGKSCKLTCDVDEALMADVARGDSIAINGCCLTVTEFGNGWAAFDVSQETLAVTNLGRLRLGSKVNLERALQMGKRLGGHLVSGHIDGMAELVDFERSGDGSRLVVRIDRALSRYTIKKGSATLDGISLTINDVIDHASSSELHFMIIPETLAKTTLGLTGASWAFNVEVDMLAKFAERLEHRR